MKNFLEIFFRNSYLNNYKIIYGIFFKNDNLKNNKNYIENKDSS
jgi:hypothetical protein